jgi:hypothetical protein
MVYFSRSEYFPRPYHYQQKQGKHETWQRLSLCTRIFYLHMRSIQGPSKILLLLLLLLLL